MPIGAAHADEVSDLKSEAKALQKQNDALAKRLATVEKRQKAIDTDTTKRIMNAYAADMPMPVKAYPAAAVDDGLCWKGVCLYGIVDAGFGWQSHGQSFNGAFPTGAQYLVSAGSNRSMWTASPNAMSQSTIGLKGAFEVLPDLNAIFKVETGFDPMSGQLANGEGSMQQNNGVPLDLRSANGDSSRNGQALNGQAYVGLSSPTYGTLTVGRNNSLTLDQILGYDPMGGSYAFSPIGFSGTWAGAGSTEDARLDQSLKYTWNHGPVHAGVIYQVGNYGSSSGTSDWVHDDLQGDIGFNYQGFSVDGTVAKVRGMVSASPLSPSPGEYRSDGTGGDDLRQRRVDAHREVQVGQVRGDGRLREHRLRQSVQSRAGGLRQQLRLRLQHGEQRRFPDGQGPPDDVDRRQVAGDRASDLDRVLLS